ncbi:MAG: putative Zn peptidase [Rhodobacteraceae bacterium HLUCCA12]|nr:MAG: putative Zn peptidase [Rhodobacteraceae bacterium HLUCCA12]
MKIDRMEIDDAGANPKKLADAITKQLGDTPCKVDVRKIAADIDIYEIREQPLTGLAGCLVVPEDKSIGAIAVDGRMTEERKRYTIGHEIGHYVNPMHRASSAEGFKCTRKDMLTHSAAPGDKHAKMEMEANQFAAELLMPADWVRRLLRKKIGVDLQHILDMASLFEVSKEAAARRYLTFAAEPAAVVFSHEGKVRYVRKHDDFPRLSVWNGQSLHPDCYSMTNEKERGYISDVIEAVGHHWLENSRGVSLGEQTIAQANGYRMTLLTVELEEEEEWEPPLFRR